MRVLEIEREAFAASDVADLVADLLEDPTAKPFLSLLAWERDEAVGHIMFTPARFDGVDGASISILGPLAVIPRAQRRGVGAALIAAGLERLARSGVDLVFVLGHPDYYPRHGFAPAIPLGFDAPYPISPPEAWMVRQLSEGAVGRFRGTVVCADALDHPEHWRE